MPYQPIANPAAQFHGPFLGLNTSLDPSQLGPEYAQIARNVLLTNGRIRPRPGFLSLANRDGTPIELPGPVVSIFHWPTSEQATAEKQRELIVHTASGGLYSVIDGEQPAVVELLAEIGSHGRVEPLCWALHGPALYFCAGGVVYLTRGRRPGGSQPNTYVAGLEVPVENTSEVAGEFEITAKPAGVPGGIGASVAYAFTRYASGTPRRESNIAESTVDLGDGINVYDCTAANTGVEITLYNPPAAGTNHYWTHIGVYRKNLTLGETGYRRVRLLNVPHGSNETVWVDDVWDEAVTAFGYSDPVNGPFGPTRNGVPQPASLCAVYQDRMVYDLLDEQSDFGTCQFSGIGKPWAVDPSDIISVRGDGDEKIHGLQAVGDQLFIGKRKAIWALSGTILTATNETNATGAIPPRSEHRVQRTRATDGPLRRQGNGFVMAGRPMRVLFGNDVGFFAFDGIDATLLSRPIDSIWDAFVSQGLYPGAHECSFSFAVDGRFGIIFIARNEPAIGTDPANPTGSAPILAYHYGIDQFLGLGGWTQIDVDEEYAWVGPFDPPASGLYRALALASTGGEPVLTNEEFDPEHFPEPPWRNRDETRSQYIPFVLGTQTGHLLALDEAAKYALRPAFQWRSGELRPIPGLRAHIYGVKWFVGNGYGQISNPPPANFELAVTLNNQERTAARDVSRREYVYQRVSGEGPTIVLEARAQPNWMLLGGSDTGITGWELNTEPVGQR